MHTSFSAAIRYPMKHIPSLIDARSTSNHQGSTASSRQDSTLTISPSRDHSPLEEIVIHHQEALQNPMPEICADVLLEIMEYLTLEELGTMAQVNKSWQQWVCAYQKEFPQIEIYGDYSALIQQLWAKQAKQANVKDDDIDVEMTECAGQHYLLITKNSDTAKTNGTYNHLLNAYRNNLAYEFNESNLKPVSCRTQSALCVSIALSLISTIVPSIVIDRTTCQIISSGQDAKNATQAMFSQSDDDREVTCPTFVKPLISTIIPLAIIFAFVLYLKHSCGAQRNEDIKFLKSTRHDREQAHKELVFNQKDLFLLGMNKQNASDIQVDLCEKFSHYNKF